jgi:hypothetical protein
VLKGNGISDRDSIEVFCRQWYTLGWRIVEGQRGNTDDREGRLVTKGDHRQFKHPSKSGRVTISGNTARDMPAGTLNSVLKQAGLKGLNR